jgi:hypothetical protein
MRARRDAIRSLVDVVKPGIVCFKETKLARISQGDQLSLLGSQFSEFAYLPASDTRGGILIAGRCTLLTIFDPHVGVFSITV